MTDQPLTISKRSRRSPFKNVPVLATPLFQRAHCHRSSSPRQSSHMMLPNARISRRTGRIARHVSSSCRQGRARSQWARSARMNGSVLRARDNVIT